MVMSGAEAFPYIFFKRVSAEIDVGILSRI
jgi:hypothetical protein